jgi:hypothetical protein
MIPQINVVEALRCDRCSGQPYLTAQIPHPSYLYPELQPEFGMLTFHLCPRCDDTDPAAQGILAFFTAYPSVTPDTAEVFSRLLEEWVGRVAVPPAVSPEAFEQDLAAFRRGDLD